MHHTGSEIRSGTPKALKYYDPELQNAANSDDAERYRTALRKHARLRNSYLRHLGMIRDRVSRAAYARLSAERNPLFDNNLLAFTVGDGFGNVLSTKGWNPKTRAEASFVDFDLKKVHLLSYSGLDCLQLNMPHEQWFDSGNRRNRDIDSLIHNELTAAGSDLLRHTFLFTTGTTIEITFRKLRWITKPFRR
jgi:hypothetical protein